MSGVPSSTPWTPITMTRFPWRNFYRLVMVGIRCRISGFVIALPFLPRKGGKEKEKENTSLLRVAACVWAN